MIRTLSVALLVAVLPPASAAPPIDREALRAEVDRLVADHGEGLAVGVWFGDGGGVSWFDRAADEARPTASAIKVVYLVELFDAFAERLDEPLPGLDEVLNDDAHPALAPFTPAVREEIRRALAGATVRRIGEVMIGKAEATNAVYNAAANVTTAVLGGPEGLSRRIHDRDPEFASLAVRRYMLADRRASGDNEATPAGLAAVWGRIASGRLRGVEPATLAAIRDVLRAGDEPGLGPHFRKSGELNSDPLTRVRSGYWDTPRGPIVYVVMAEQPRPGGRSRDAAGTRLEETVSAIVAALRAAARPAATAPPS